jgi:arginyl-tRNA--protein-N-Asp/Glu arginylyltransferase
MRELIRLVEAPRACPYLPRQTAALELRIVAAMTAADFGDLLARGYRRFGHYFFRPACPACRQCRSLRVCVPAFVPSAGQRRVLRKNQGVRAELGRPEVTPDRVELFNRYHRFMRRHRGWPYEPATAGSYAESFLADFEFAREWRYFEQDRLLGVALMDETPGAISLVYCYYDPAWRPRSPGAFSILHQLRYARDKGLRYAYLGYWIADCPSMSYKARFGPHEILRDYPPDNEPPVWELQPPAAMASCEDSGVA